MLETLHSRKERNLIFMFIKISEVSPKCSRCKTNNSVVSSDIHAAFRIPPSSETASPRVSPAVILNASVHCAWSASNESEDSRVRGCSTLITNLSQKEGQPKHTTVYRPLQGAPNLSCERKNRGAITVIGSRVKNDTSILSSGLWADGDSTEIFQVQEVPFECSIIWTGWFCSALLLILVWGGLCLDSEGNCCNSKPSSFGQSNDILIRNRNQQGGHKHAGTVGAHQTAKVRTLGAIRANDVSVGHFVFFPQHALQYVPVPVRTGGTFRLQSVSKREECTR